MFPSILRMDEKSVNKPHDRGGQKRSITIIYHPVFPETLHKHLWKNMLLGFRKMSEWCLLITFICLSLY